MQRNLLLAGPEGTAPDPMHQPMKPERLVALGAVVRPHGVRGELRVHRFNPESTLLLETGVVWLREGHAPREVRVESARAHGASVLLVLEGCRSREAAELLRGAEVCVSREALPPPDEDEVYHADLLGLRVRTDDGAVSGEVVEVLTYPSAECLLVRSEEGDREVPFLAPYLVRVDLAAREVVVAHLEDLDLMPSRARR